MSWGFVRRSWYFFRHGHSTYLGFLLSFTNFLLIAYNFLVTQISFLNNLFDNLVVFALVGCAVYIPLATIIGYWHVTRQLATDEELRSERNPVYLDILKRLESIEGKIDG